MTLLVGCDFSSSPSRRKQIVLATGRVDRGRVLLQALERVSSLDAFSAWLLQHPVWTGAFDLPFGLPRVLVQTLGWPLEWEPCIRHYASL